MGRRMNRRELIRIAVAVLGCELSESLLRGVQAMPFRNSRPSRDLFSGETRELVKVIAELIIPETDTPGAIEAGVPAFIELMVTDWLDDDGRRAFFSGLESLEVYCSNQHRHSFLDCSAEQRTQALQHAEREDSAFFARIKQLTVVGYYTSEIGATQELRYNPTPGRYDGDYPLAKVGRQWSY